RLVSTFDSVVSIVFGLLFFIHAAAPTDILPLSLHDALPISGRDPAAPASRSRPRADHQDGRTDRDQWPVRNRRDRPARAEVRALDRKSTRLNSSHVKISYAVFCLKKKTSCR